MRRRIGIGALAAALLVSGVMVGVSSGGSEAITQPGPYTERGLISSVGLFRGAEHDTYTVTGGSGAYDNVRGDAAERCKRKGCTFTLELTP